LVKEGKHINSSWKERD